MNCRRGRSRRVIWPTLVLAGFAGCLSDEATSRLSEDSETLGGDGDRVRAVALALPPGGIIDTQPDSGWTEGSFSVNHNGAAEYHLPLWLPDGRGGLQPELALHYDSQNGNGLVGVGWSLAAGLSSITPCTRTLAQDGRIENPGFWTGDDAFCLDGQRLRPTDSEWSEEQDYRTERDIFSRIRAYSPPADDPTPPPNYFKVWSRDGRILTFDAVLRAYALTGQDPEEPSFDTYIFRVPAAWALSKIEDRNGNAITIEYEIIEDEGNQWSVEMVPRLITYGPDRRVEFVYEDRPDPVNSFRAGVKADASGGIHTELGRRLATIRVSAGTELLREYRLTYGNDSISGRSRLVSVTECDGAVPAGCLNSLQFDWSLGRPNSFEVIDTDVTDAAVAAWDGRYYIPGDIDGDGRDDLLYRNVEGEWKIRMSTGNGFGPAQDAGIQPFTDDDGEAREPRVRPIDFDRDGRMDVMVEVTILNDVTQFVLYRSTGSTYEVVFADPTIFSRIAGGLRIEGLWGGFFADIDGNGLPDYLGAVLDHVPDDEPDNRLHWRYRRNLGSGFGDYEEGADTDGPLPMWEGNVRLDYQIRSMIFDGPRARLLYWSPAGTGYRTLLLQENRLIGDIYAHNLPFLREPENTDRRNLHLADVNGDGLDDAVYPCTGLNVQLSSGLGFSELLTGPSEYEPCRPTFADDNLRIRVVDFTGDGADDILLIHPGEPDSGADHEHGIQLYTWTGQRFTRVATNIGVTPVSQGGEPIGAIQPLDIDGDGLMDIAKVERRTPETSSSFLRILRREGEIPDRLIRVQVAGLGARVEIDYTTLANGAVHTPGTENCSYPLTCPRRGGNIVSRHRLANGMTAGSPWHQFTHHYTAACVDLRGHGWLGFERHDTRDEERPDAVTTAFLDNHTRGDIPLGDGVTAYVYPFAGRPYKVLYTVISGIVNGSPATYEHTIDRVLRFRLGASPGSWVRRLETVTVSDRERIGAGAWTDLHSRTKTFDQYDDFENVTRATTVVPGSDRGDVLTYENDTTNWLIGLPRTRTATSCTRPDNECQTRASSLAYDANGNLEETVVEPGDEELLLRTTIAYGSFGNIFSVTNSDAAGETRTTSFTYDALDLYPRSTTNALGHTSSATVHSGLGVVLDSQDANGVVPATMKYDRFGRLREINHADGNFERHFTAGPLFRFTLAPDGADRIILAQTTVLDVLGRPTDRSIPAFEGGFSSVRTTYDRLGRVATVSRPYLSGSEEPLQNTTYGYDDRDRLLTRVEPDGVTTRHEYIGRETHTYDGKNIHSYVVERADGQIDARFEDDPKSTGWLETSFDYGPFGLVRQTVAADGTSQNMGYDERGRRIRHVDPSTGTTTWIYNAFGELRHELSGTGEERHVQIRDLLGRPWRVSSPDGLTTYTWDRPGALGKLDVSTQHDTNGHYVITRFTYDEIGRNTRTSWEIDDDSFFEVDAGFDGIGRLASISYPRLAGENAPARFKVNYAYHPAGYLLAATDAATGARYWQAESRQPDGQLTQETFGNGVVGIREYQPETGLLETLTTDGPRALLDQLVYGHDANRNVSFRGDVVGDGARSLTFTYDTLDRLASWTHRRVDESDPVTTAFDHDTVGNLLSETVTGRTGRNVTYRYGQDGAPPHALTMRNGQRYSYDGAGRRIAGAALGSITYNRRNLPIRIERQSGGTTELAYDAAGARVLKRTSDSTRFSVAGLFERSIGNQVRNDHSILAEGREVAQVTLIQEAPEGPVIDIETRYIHSDGQGSSVLVTNEAGTTVAELFYDPFGGRTDRNYDPLSGMVPVRPGYTGHRHDDELAFIDMKGRVYDVETRRFLTPDPFVQAPLFSQSHNRYSYVWNNPATLIDSSGLCADEDPADCDDEPVLIDPKIIVDAVVAADDALDEIDDAILGALGDLFGGGSREEAPRSDDKYQTDLTSYGSGGGPGVGGDNWVEVSGTGPGWSPVDFSDLGTRPPPELGWFEATPSGWRPLEADEVGNPRFPLQTITVTPEMRERMRNPVQIGIAPPNPAAAATLGAVGLAATRVASSPAGGALIVRAGQMGEAAVRSAVDIGSKVAIQIAGRVRIPDGVLNKVLTEIKNVGSLSYTRQLRDFVGYANQYGLRFDLWIRSNTQLSGPLAQEVANGVINLRTIP